jgi:ankyrin repeat protein
MMTPLLYAVRKGHVDMARQLMELGAERDATDRTVSIDVDVIGPQLYISCFILLSRSCI